MDELFPRRAHARDRRPRCVVEPIDTQRAARLRAFVERQPNWGVRRSPRAWAEPFALLRRSMESHRVIDSVLDWYVVWWQPGKRPTIRDGLAFRRLWGWLLTLWERECPGAVTVADLCPDGQWIYGELSTYTWPGVTLDRLPMAIRDSIHNYQLFEIIVTHANVPPGVRDVLETLLAEPRTYFVRWFTDVWRRYHGWAAWDGDLRREVWSKQHSRFVADMMGRIQQHTGMDAESVRGVIHQLQ